MSAQTVTTQGASVTIGWLKWQGANSARVRASSVTIRLYNCILPQVEARAAECSMSDSTSSSIGVDLYFRIERWFAISLIMGLSYC